MFLGIVPVRKSRIVPIEITPILLSPFVFLNYVIFGKVLSDDKYIPIRPADALITATCTIIISFVGIIVAVTLLFLDIMTGKLAITFGLSMILLFIIERIVLMWIFDRAIAKNQQSIEKTDTDE